MIAVLRLCGIKSYTKITANGSVVASVIAKGGQCQVTKSGISLRFDDNERKEMPRMTICI
jgi:hypothetical protein